MAAAAAAGRKSLFLPRQKIFLIKQTDGSVWGLEADRRNRMIRFRGAAAALLSFPVDRKGTGIEDHDEIHEKLGPPDAAARKEPWKRSCL